MINKLKNISKTQKIILLITFIIIMILTFLLSYSYIAPLVDDSAKENIQIEGVGTETLTFEKGNDISLNINPENFGQGAGNIASETTLVVKARANKSGEAYNAKYNVFFNIGINDYEYSSGNIPELILTITDPNGNMITSLPGMTYTTQNGVSGFDITTKAGNINVATDYEITSPSYDVVETQIWTFKVTMIAHTFDQNVNQGKNLTAQLEATKSSTATEVTIGQTCIGEKLAECITQNSELDPSIVQHTPQLANSAGDYNYRYTGGNDVVTNNYVMFNNELWRIVGIFNESAHGIENESLIKIVKEEGFNYKYNIDNSNKWESTDGSVADLNEIYNNYYYNRTNGTSFEGCKTGNYIQDIDADCDFTDIGLTEESRNMIQTSSWHLGAGASAAVTSREMYEIERSLSTTSGGKTIANDNIGLIYVSDYGYASSESCWTKTLNNYNADSCQINNWLNFNNLTQWLIMPVKNSNGYGAVFQANSQGIVYAGNGAHNAPISRPTVYLKKDIILNGGAGTMTDPFIINF